MWRMVARVWKNHGMEHATHPTFSQLGACIPIPRSGLLRISRSKKHHEPLHVIHHFAEEQVDFLRRRVEDVDFDRNENGEKRCFCTTEFRGRQVDDIPAATLYSWVTSGKRSRPVADLWTLDEEYSNVA